MGYAKLKPGDIIKNNKNYVNYKIVKFLGDGGYSSVWRAYDTKNNKVKALKFQRDDGDYPKWGNEEKEFLQLVKNIPNVINVETTFMYKDHLVFVFEEMDTSLTDYLAENEIPFNDKIVILKDIITGLKAIQDLGIIHGDIKTDNVMLKDKKPFIIDFSLSFMEHKAVKNTQLQTVFYRSPEVILGCEFNKTADLWSLGCLIYKLFVGHHIFNCDRYLESSDESSDEYSGDSDDSEDSEDSEDSHDDVRSFKDELITLREMLTYLGEIPYKEFRKGSFYKRYFRSKGRLLLSETYSERKSIRKDVIECEDIPDEYKEVIINIIESLLQYSKEKRMKLDTILESKLFSN